jgi:hypothetical protein
VAAALPAERHHLSTTPQQLRDLFLGSFGLTMTFLRHFNSLLCELACVREVVAVAFLLVLRRSQALLSVFRLPSAGKNFRVKYRSPTVTCCEIALPPMLVVIMLLM